MAILALRRRITLPEPVPGDRLQAWWLPMDHVAGTIRQFREGILRTGPLLAVCLLLAVLTGHVVAESVRFATFNASLSRRDDGALADALLSARDPQIQAVAAIIRTVNPDVLLLNEFDYGSDNGGLFVANYLGGSYPYVFAAPSNTGVPTGVDLDGDGVIGTTRGTRELAADAHGYGFFEGQYGMLVLSRHPVEEDRVRTFQQFLWKDMPGARLPMNPDGKPFYSPEAVDILRLSSKSHWDVPVDVGNRTVHLLASHPTPPVFDGEEDRNGRRNADEIRFWADYISGADYFVDDAGNRGGLPSGASFVIAGDLNADPFDGDSTDGAVLQLLEHPLIQHSFIPGSEGGAAAAVAQGGANHSHRGDPREDTADFRDRSPGNLRVDYVLPSVQLEITGGGVFWPQEGETGFEWIQASDHRLVWIDIAVPGD